MKKVYVQIIAPIKGTTLNACHEYPSEYNQAVEATLRICGLHADENYSTMNGTGEELPGMPEYLLVHGVESGTSQIVSLIVVG